MAAGLLPVLILTAGGLFVSSNDPKNKKEPTQLITKNAYDALVEQLASTQTALAQSSDAASIAAAALQAEEQISESCTTALNGLFVSKVRSMRGFILTNYLPYLTTQGTHTHRYFVRNLQPNNSNAYAFDNSRAAAEASANFDRWIFDMEEFREQLSYFLEFGAGFGF